MSSAQKTPAMQSEIDELYAVQLDNVTKDFGSVLGLDDVTVGFRTGEVTVLLGLSGSGKSTLLRHINGLHMATTGTVRTLGQDVKAMGKSDRRALRRRIGMIFQDFNLIGPMSVLENVCTGALGGLRGPRLTLMMYPKQVRRDAIRHLDRVGLADRAFQRADTLSGGQQQRVAIARALMQKPEVLLADEPVASLDPVSSAQVMSLLREICAEDNLTVITSLHQVQLSLDFGDRIVGLRGGQLVFDHNTEDLTAEEASTIYDQVAKVSEEELAEAEAEDAVPVVGTSPHEGQTD